MKGCSLLFVYVEVVQHGDADVTIVSRFDNSSYTHSNEYDMVIVDEDINLFVSLMPDMFGGSEDYYAKMSIKDITYYDSYGQAFNISYQ